MLRLVRTSERGQLFNELCAFVGGKEFGSLDRIDDCFQFCNLQCPRSYKIAILAAFGTDNVKTAFLQLQEVCGNGFRVA